MVYNQELREKENIEWFNKMVPRAAKLHPFTYCVKERKVVETRKLKGEDCVRCKEFVLNGGVCDPL